MMYKISNQDVIEWCKTYSGPKFHALLCDPPYHLTDTKHMNARQDNANYADSENAKRYGNKANPFCGKTKASKGFMGKEWDGGNVAFCSETWQLLAEHLHDGAFIMAFASSRGWHRQAVAMEDAGLTMHPTIFLWGYGSGFPKATRIDTQVDKAAGAERKVIGKYKAGTNANPMDWGNKVGEVDVTGPVVPLAKIWTGHRYGLQALKPATEPILVFQKPYRGKPVECITKTGAGALNIDGARIGLNGERVQRDLDKQKQTTGEHGKYGKFANSGSGIWENTKGRWPSHFIISHIPECIQVGVKKVKGGSGWSKTGSKESENVAMSGKNYTRTPKPDNYEVDENGCETIPDWRCPEHCPARRLGEQSGILHPAGNIKEMKANDYIASSYKISYSGQRGLFRDTGTASRFFFNADYTLEKLEEADPVFYCAKAGRKERDAGLDERAEASLRPSGVAYNEYSGVHREKKRGNLHPTVKPIKLTQHLATLLLPPREYTPRRILIPFAGSGSEMIGALLAGWEEIIGIELEEEYCRIAQARLDFWETKAEQISLW